MQTPEISGVMNGYKVSLFSSEHFSEDMRGSRKLTAIEVSLNSTMPFDGAVANGGMVPIVKSLEFKTEYRPEHERWDNSFIVAGDSSYALKRYLNDKRVDVLARTMKIRNAWVIFIFRNNAMLLRMDTPEPISNLEELEKLIVLLCKAAQILELGKGESAILKSEASKAERRDMTIEIEGGDVAESKVKAVALELEEEGEEQAVPAKADVKEGAEKKASGKIQVSSSKSKSKPDTSKS